MTFHMAERGAVEWVLTHHRSDDHSAGPRVKVGDLVWIIGLADNFGTISEVGRDFTGANWYRLMGSLRILYEENVSTLYVWR